MDRSRVGTLKSMRSRWGKIIASCCIRPISTPLRKRVRHAKGAAPAHRAGARTREALIEAMGRSLEAVTSSDARGFFEHRGYRAQGHLLWQTL